MHQGSDLWVNLTEAARIIGRHPSKTRRVLDAGMVRRRPSAVGSRRIVFHRGDVAALLDLPVSRGPLAEPTTAMATA